MGEGRNEPLRMDLDGSLKLGCHGARATSDPGLLACRELDETLGVTETQVERSLKSGVAFLEFALPSRGNRRAEGQIGHVGLETVIHRQYRFSIYGIRTQWSQPDSSTPFPTRDSGPA